MELSPLNRDANTDHRDDVDELDGDRHQQRQRRQHHGHQRHRSKPDDSTTTSPLSTTTTAKAAFGVITTFFIVYLTSAILSVALGRPLNGGATPPTTSSSSSSSDMLPELPDITLKLAMTDGENRAILVDGITNKYNGSARRLRNSVATVIMEGLADTRLKSPFTAIISGPTGSGKTQLVKRLIARRRDLCTEPPEEIIYCYGAWQDDFANITDARFHEGLIDFDADLPTDGRPRWLIIDDLMAEMSEGNETEKLFTKHSHHKNVSVFVITQNFFQKGFRTLTLNAHYLFLFKNPRDASQIASLARQLYPNNSRFLVESYADATKVPHSYLTVDLTQGADERLRVLGHFAHPDIDHPIVAYSPK